jgi:hypothetical protein
MYSAAVNKALAQYFQLESPVPDTIPGNTPNNILGNISNNTPDNILALFQQMAEKMEAMEERLGKLRA